MSELDDAFTELKDAKAEAIGNKREYVILNGRKVEALVSEITSDEAFVSGGIAQEGGFHCQIAAKDLANQPAKFTPIQVRGTKLQVLSCNSINGVTYDITAADPAIEGRG